MNRTEHAQSANCDAGEIAKFEQLADRWWDTEGEFRPLHDMNPLRANYIDERAQLAEKNVLDIGCGGGILCEAMAQRGAKVTGVQRVNLIQSGSGNKRGSGANNNANNNLLSSKPESGIIDVAFLSSLNSDMAMERGTSKSNLGIYMG